LSDSDRRKNCSWSKWAMHKARLNWNHEPIV